jgi:transcription antitermination factor NusG
VAESNWLILELNEYGEAATRGELEYSLREMLGQDAEFFIPIHHEKMGSYISTSVLFEGYIFIRDSLEIRARLGDIRDFRLFSRILESNGRIQTVDSRTIGGLRRKLKNSMRKRFNPGTPVKILEGTFKDLIGEVMSVENNGRKVMVQVKRLSREMIIPVPSTSIREADPVEIM